MFVVHHRSCCPVPTPAGWVVGLRKGIADKHFIKIVIPGLVWQSLFEHYRTEPETQTQHSATLLQTKTVKIFMKNVIDKTRTQSEISYPIILSATPAEQSALGWPSPIKHRRSVPRCPGLPALARNPTSSCALSLCRRRVLSYKEYHQ